MKKHRFYFVYCSICIKFENEKVQDCTNTGYFFDGKAKKVEEIFGGDENYECFLDVFVILESLVI